MAITHEIPSEQYMDLDLVQQRLIVVYANQYDNDGVNGVNNVIHCFIYNNGEPYNLTGTTVTIKIKKPNGYMYSSVVTSMGGTVEGNCITFPMNNQFTNHYGRCECNFELTYGQDKKNTCNFYLRIYKAPIQQEQEKEEDHWHDIDEKYEETQEQIKLLANEYVTTNSTPPSEADDNDWWTEFVD